MCGYFYRSCVDIGYIFRLGYIIDMNMCRYIYISTGGVYRERGRAGGVRAAPARLRPLLRVWRHHARAHGVPARPVLGREGERLQLAPGLGMLHGVHQGNVVFVWTWVTHHTTQQSWRSVSMSSPFVLVPHYYRMIWWMEFGYKVTNGKGHFTLI